MQIIKLVLSLLFVFAINAPLRSDNQPMLYKCGFVNDSEVEKGSTQPFFPAAILQMEDNQFYLFTYSCVSPKNYSFCYELAEFKFSCPARHLLTERPARVNSFSRGLAAIYLIPFLDLDSDLRDVVLKVAVKEEWFVNTPMGAPITTFAQSTVKDHGPSIQHGIIAGLNHTSNGVTYPKRLPYNLVLPISKDAACFSWISSSGNHDNSPPRIVGLMIDRAPLKFGDCFLDIQVLKALITNSEWNIAFNGYEKRFAEDQHVIWVSNLVKPGRIRDRSNTTGSNPKKHKLFKGADDISLLQAVNLGVPGIVLNAGGKIYLLLQNDDELQVKPKSLITVVNSLGYQTYSLGDYFELNQDFATQLVDKTFRIIPAKATEIPAQLERSSVDLNATSKPAQGDTIFWGISIPKLIHSSRYDDFEVSIVFCNTSASEVYPDTPAVNFDCGIYPALIFQEQGGKFSLHGILGLNSDSHTARVFQLEELKGRLPK